MICFGERVFHTWRLARPGSSPVNSITNDGNRIKSRELSAWRENLSARIQSPATLRAKIRKSACRAHAGLAEGYVIYNRTMRNYSTFAKQNLSSRGEAAQRHEIKFENEMRGIMKRESDESIDYVYLGRVVISFSNEINAKHILHKRYIERKNINKSYWDK